MTNELKFCKDCKWFNKSEYSPEDLGMSKCSSPEREGKPNLVTGLIPTLFCEVTRKYSHLCGKEAKWFEVKDATYSK